MALSDILERIARDAESEAAAVMAAADEEAARILEEASAAAAARQAEIEAAARTEARLQADTILANTRLRARDLVLGQKRTQIRRVLDEAKAAIVGLPDERYVGLLARSVVASRRGTERLLVAAADRERLAATLPAALAAAGVGDVSPDDAEAPIDHGIMLVGDRTTVDLSIDALVDGRAEELSPRIASVLFGEEGA